MEASDARRRSKPAAVTAGLGAGFISGLLGGGGGAIMIPLMIGPLRMTQHVAHGTSLVVITGTAALAAALYSFSEPIGASLVLAMAAGAVVGAFAGARAAAKLPALQLRQVFGIFLTAISLRILLWRPAEPLLVLSGWHETAAASAIGLAGGLCSGGLGVGGGSIFVPALVLLLGTGQHEAQGISLWVVVAASLSGAWSYLRLGAVDVDAARWIAPPALPGAIAGVFAAAFMGGRTLQVVFAAVLTVIGLQMLLTARWRLRQQRLAQPLTVSEPA